MYKLSFKVKHKGCAETGLSIKFPKHHITVVDIQSLHQKEKQYLYYINGDSSDFDAIITAIRKSQGYRFVKEIERSNDTLLILVVLFQKSYIQNIIQKYHAFLIELHTVSEGYEFWHIGVIERESIDTMLIEFKKMGELKVLYIGEADFGHSILSKQQKKVFNYAHEQGYYNIPRKTTIKKIAKELRLSHATAGEHLLKAENRIINSMAKTL